MDAVRRRTSQAIREEREAPMPAPADDPVARVELDHALRSVSDEHRQPFLLIEVFGLSYQEAADVLGVKVGTVKSRMFRARHALAAALSTDDVDRDEREAGGGL